VKRKEDIRREQIVPNETLFVVNFHEETTRKEDLEMLFQPYGELVRIDMKRNYAFVQFSTVEQAKAAKEATNGGKLDQSAITVEFVARRMTDDHRPPRRDRHDDNRGGRPYRERGNRDYEYDRNGSMDYRRDDRGGGGRRGGRYEDDIPPPRERRGPFREDRYEDRMPPRGAGGGGGGGPRGGGPWRGGRSPDRFPNDYDRRRPSSRSRSRSPPAYRRPRGRDSHMNGGREDEGERRGGRGGYDRVNGGSGAGGGSNGGGSGERRDRGEDREYGDYKRGRGSGAGANYERSHGRSDDRGYVEGGENEAR